MSLRDTLKKLNRKVEYEPDVVGDWVIITLLMSPSLYKCEHLDTGALSETFDTWKEAYDFCNGQRKSESPVDTKS